MKKWKIRAVLLLLVVSLTPSAAVTASSDAEVTEKMLENMIPCTSEFLFEDGDVVGFIGDSITHVEYTGISYQEFIYNYYITRYPKWRLEFRNLGTASYTAADAVSLYSGQSGIRDAEFEGITKAVIMFGMNEALALTPAETYIQNVQRLVELLKEQGLESEDIILVAPTPYDQTRSSNFTEDGKQQEHTDDLLKEYVPALKQLAQDLGTHFVDLHTPMLWVTEIVQSRFEDDTLTVTDNIHPDAMGNTLAGFFFLYQQGADNLVASVQITGDGEAVTDNAAVKGIRRKGDRYIRFKYRAGSLPMAVSYEFHEATQYFDVIDMISWENLQVDGLHSDTKYTLYIDHAAAGTYTGAQLGKGVNLTDCDLSAMQMAAKEIEVLNQNWQVISADYRSVIRSAAKGEATQEDVDAAYAQYSQTAEALRGEMYEIADSNAAKTHTIELVSEGYHVFMGQELWHWAVELAGALLAGAAVLYYIFRKKRRQKTSGE